MESGSDNDTATRRLLDTIECSPVHTGLQGSGHRFAAAAKFVDNKLSNHISHGHRLHVMSRRFEERTPLRGGCHPARNQHVGLEQRDRDMMINDSRGVSFMVSGLSVPEIAVEAAACPTNNLASPIVLNDDPRSERISITVNVMDGVLALESRHGWQVISSWCLRSAIAGLDDMAAAERLTIRIGMVERVITSCCCFLVWRCWKTWSFHHALALTLWRSQ